eukprot:CAMPEP_0184862536 /NCGR_PEP_ID=MMETSP0580-20130426/6997_1 /TAXON_ID=1118495 /ORGANISM="Dactyliosolen fragilissimus" /LENGTH=868 /DNA_ID=CAMNT_0027360459 /DNA_START=369 /DNA_END=2975 /DNA_ORIENTATION=+
MKVSSSAVALLIAATQASAFSPSQSLSSFRHTSTHVSPNGIGIRTPTFVPPFNNVKNYIHDNSIMQKGLTSLAMLKPDAIITADETVLDSGVAPVVDVNINKGTNLFDARAQEEAADAIAAQVSLDAARESVSSYLNKYQGQSGASIVYSKLQEHGVEVVNGYSGGAVLPLLDQFHEQHPRHAIEGASKPIRWITNSNENSAGHIAEGYAKAANPSIVDGRQPAGVVVATSGPGVTNLITPLQDAICDGVPMVVLCGQAATTAPPDAFQQADAVGLTTPCTKWSYQIKSAAELPFVMDYAFYIARHGRPGPVFIDLPKDLQNQVIDADLIASHSASIPVRNGSNNNDSGVMRFIPEVQGVNGSARIVGHTLHLGKGEQGILFDVDNKEGDVSISPITNMDLGGKEGVYQMDHHPSNTIHKPLNSLGNKNDDDDLNLEEASVTGELKVDSQITTEILELVKKAEKPFIIAGQGCNNCPEDLLKFAEETRIPVATTLHALGCFDERHELALNMLGMHGHPTPNYMIQESDLVLCIGSRFDDRITGQIGGFIPEAKKADKKGTGGVIHVDIRITEKSKQVQPTYFVHSTGKKFLETMNEALQKSPLDADALASRESWLEKKSDLQEAFPVKTPKFPTEQITSTDKNGDAITLKRTRMSAQGVVSELNRQILEAGMMDDCLFSTGVGIHQMVAAQLITWTQPRQMVTSGSLGTMGVALGFVIGCKIAQGHKMCIAIDGDGSFNMTFTELKTVAEQKIPVKIMILDNESQMMVEYWQRLFHEERYLAVTNTVNPKYGTLADAFGIRNLYCDAEEDLPEMMRQFLFEEVDEPTLFHVRIERTPCLPLVAPGKPLQEMILDDNICTDFDACAAPS